MTSLMAAAYTQKWDVVLLLLSKGASVQAYNRNTKRTALHYAALRGAPDAVLRALVEAGANTMSLDIHGRTPAVTARRSEQPAAASCLDQLSGLTSKAVRVVAPLSSSTSSPVAVTPSQGQSLIQWLERI